MGSRQRVTIRLGVLALSGTQGSAHTGHIDHNHGPAQVLGGKMGDDPHQGVSAATGSPGNDQFYWLGWIFFCNSRNSA